ncbi:sulfatase-like hydrolase/transferase [Myroides sp. 1354]|uniref:LTA synthase family protein n=1 Tax=unclassified Myroides TaxID=2642485 RepID=UPI0025775491|nr:MULTISPECIES: LTA synthase family protein [unclassified Myroides]MDM1044800.1 sulfatase-like hydrolase/transferase [Myroides sp. R163-1]MDM1055513.1 sulfatase-like hydrolase/transferase [Myroides sp. 1354]MDM1068810.1 sulfatase-like hydrolase/transferase [Myroides sp. 1372]
MNKVKHIKKTTTSCFDLLGLTVKRLLGLAVGIGFLLRMVLAFQVREDLNLLYLFKLSVLGMINDISLTLILCLFIGLQVLGVSHIKYKKPWGYFIFGCYVALLLYVLFFNTIFHEYGNVVPTIAQGFFFYKALSFGLRLFIPTIRSTWSYVIYVGIVFIYAVVLVQFVALGEYLFWDEFGVRYNFIAVDYLIYTNEVVGNIAESYPIKTILISVVVLATLLTYWVVRGTKSAFAQPMESKQRISALLGYSIAVVVSIGILNYTTKFQTTDNVYYNELQANGGYKFYQAFKSSRLDYNHFYEKLDEKQAQAIVNEMYSSKGMENIQTIVDTVSTSKKNIVLITVESLSASFMERYGNTDQITPNLDQLAKESLVFDNLFAVGNRTVRGLEAVTLSRPPSAGESLVKQDNNADLFSLGKVLKNQGYQVQYLYGGDSYFDNMKTFFGGNHYEIIDKSALNPSEISFSNIWGVCDEDMFAKALKTFDANSAKGQPFFSHIMTVSNHRPYTYPEGKINIAGDSQSRDGGVKYTDYAIGKFIEQAKTKSWFKDTVFVILADHCASSAGKASLPLERYRIPALIYAPGFIQPKAEKRLVSQIDVMPTLLGLLHFTYESRFFGQDIYNKTYQERAFLATYQNLGYLENDILTVLSPNRKVEQFKVTLKEDGEYRMEKQTQLDEYLMKRAVANYQVASYDK